MPNQDFRTFADAAAAAQRPPARHRDKRRTIRALRQLAEQSGFTVRETAPDDSRVSLDITRNPAEYQFEAYFQRDPETRYWRWDYGVVHYDTTADRIATLARFREHLS